MMGLQGFTYLINAMQLSKNFQLQEFTISQTAERFGINNHPSESIIKHLELLCKEILQPAREALGGLSISSGYRSPQLNRRIGGSSSSAHMQGFAADILPLNCSKMDFAKWVAHNTDFDQIILEFGSKSEPAWIHVSADPRYRGQILRILPGTGYVEIELN